MLNSTNRQTAHNTAPARHLGKAVMGGGRGGSTLKDNYTYSVEIIDNPNILKNLGLKTESVKQITLSKVISGFPDDRTLEQICSAKPHATILQLTECNFTAENISAWQDFINKIARRNTIIALRLSQNNFTFAGMNSAEKSEAFNRLFCSFPKTIKSISFYHDADDKETHSLVSPIFLNMSVTQRVFVNREEYPVIILLRNIKNRILKQKQNFIFEDIVEVLKANLKSPGFSNYFDNLENLNDLIKDLAFLKIPIANFTQALLLTGEIDLFTPEELCMHDYLAQQGQAIELYAKAAKADEALLPMTRMLLSLYLDREKCRLNTIDSSGFNVDEITAYKVFFEYLHKVCATMQASATAVIPGFKPMNYNNVAAFQEIIPSFEEFKVTVEQNVPVKEQENSYAANHAAQLTTSFDALKLRAAKLEASTPILENAETEPSENNGVRANYTL